MWNFWTVTINTPKNSKNFRSKLVAPEWISRNENWVFDFDDSTLLQKLHSTFYINGKMHPPLTLKGCSHCDTKLRLLRPMPTVDYSM